MYALKNMKPCRIRMKIHGFNMISAVFVIYICVVICFVAGLFLSCWYQYSYQCIHAFASLPISFEWLSRTAFLSQWSTCLHKNNISKWILQWKQKHGFTRISTFVKCVGVCLIHLLARCYTNSHVAIRLL